MEITPAAESSEIASKYHNVPLLHKNLKNLLFKTMFMRTFLMSEKAVKDIVGAPNPPRAQRQLPFPLLSLDAPPCVCVCSL